MVTKVKYAGVCSNCGRKSEFHIRCGSHSLQVCGTCATRLRGELTTAITQALDQAVEGEYNNSVETGLIRSKA